MDDDSGNFPCSDIDSVFLEELHNLWYEKNS